LAVRKPRLTLLNVPVDWSVPPPSEKALAAAPRLLSALTLRVPALTTTAFADVAPVVKVFAPLRTSLPAPVLVSEVPAPLRTPLMVSGLVVLATEMVGVALLSAILLAK